MSGEIFMKYDGVEGESKADGHTNEVDVLSFHWGVSQPHSLARGGGGGVGKANFSELVLTTHVHKGSPTLFFNCASGTHITKGVLTARKAGGKQQEYYKLTLTDLMVTSYMPSDGINGELPTESVSLAYSKIEFEYAPQKPDGSLEASKKAGWDLVKNVKV